MGDAAQVALIDASGAAHAPGAVPAGTYTLRATFSHGVTISSAPFTVAAGGDVGFRCSSLAESCRGGS